MALHKFDTTYWAIPPPKLIASPQAHHAHHILSRRAFIGSMAGTAGAAVTAGMFPVTALAKQSNPAPKPTDYTLTLPPPAPQITFHVTFFGPGVDPSSIWDFKGDVGVADVQGKGTATNPDGSTEELLFDTDMRFMRGIYVGQDGQIHKGTFGFV